MHSFLSGWLDDRTLRTAQPRRDRGAGLSRHRDEAALERWKREHPDWFVAGHWTPPGRPAAAGSRFDEGGAIPAGRGPGERAQVQAAWDGGQAGPLDPAGLSLADFQAVRAAALTNRDDASSIILIQARPPVRGANRFSGPPRSLLEDVREHRFYEALRTIRELEPRNRELEFLRDPDKAPTENLVRRLQQEAREAVARSEARAMPSGPGEPDPATPSQRRDLRVEMVRRGAMSEDSPEEAHHIVPGGRPMSGGRDAGRAQAMLKRFNIDIDGMTNGLPLSRRFHRRLHTKPYYDYVTRRLESIGSTDGAIRFLRELASRLRMEELRFQKDNQMPNWSE